MARRRKHLGIHRSRSSALTLTLSREYTGEGTRKPLAIFAVLALAFAFSSFAYAGQTDSLRLEATAAGLIQIRGDGIQGIDWPAPGRSSVTAPLTAYTELSDDSSFQTTGPLEKADRLRPLPLKEGEETSHFTSFDDDANQLAALWQPGRSESVRHWTLLAVGVVVLTLGIAAHVDPKRATRWLVGTAIGLSIGIVYAFPANASERILPAEGQPGWEWVWRTSSTGRVEVPWSPGLRFVPGSIEQLKQADPVLHLDAAGQPISISVSTQHGQRAVFIRRVMPIQK